MIIILLKWLFLWTFQDRLIDEEFSADVSKESYNWKDMTESKFVANANLGLRKSDRAIREILDIDDDDATANDFGTMVDTNENFS